MRIYSSCGLLVAAVLSTLSGLAQESAGKLCSEGKKHSMQQLRSRSALRTATLDAAEGNYDVRYVKLDLSMTNTSTAISGSAITRALATVSGFSEYIFELEDPLVIDSVKFNGAAATWTSTGAVRTVAVPGTALPAGSLFTAQVFYHGTPPSGTDFLSTGIRTGTSPSWGNSVTYTLSQPYDAKDWWPCKQSLQDKIDSIDVWLTVPDNLMAGSNGVVTINDLAGPTRRFEWKHRSPIDYYLISVACASYIDYSFYAHYTGSDDSTLVQNFIYDNPGTLTFWKTRVDSTALMIQYFSDLFGRYPFWEEKYGHCMAPLNGGMEHQTMTTQGTFDITLTAHELGHQWFGDNVTCATWQDIWLNEGFASYLEYLYLNEFHGADAAGNDMFDRHNDIMSQPGGSVYVDDTTDENRIFDGRLSYNKGAAVVHTLRYLAPNDESFYGGLLAYREAHEGGIAYTTDLQEKMETAYSKDLDNFFNEWIYGEGYPTYGGRWNQSGNTVYIQLNQSTSMPGSVPHFNTPIELRLKSPAGDTVIKVEMPTNSELYSFTWDKPMNGFVVDPNNWIINQTTTISKDVSLSTQIFTAADAVVSPNPASSSWMVRDILQGTTLQLSDLTGRVVWEGLAAKNATEIPAANLPKGMYILSVQTPGNAVQSLKLIHE